MTKKLTIAMDEEVIRKIKRYSQRARISISKITRDYYLQLTNRKNTKTIGEELYGILEGKLAADYDWKKAKTERLEKKHL